jgi:hypothetical protein
LTLALVENFAYFVCEGGGRHYYPFGKARTLVACDDDENNETTSDAPMQHHHFMPQSSHDVFHLQISESVSGSNESGKPFCCDEPNGSPEEEGAVFSNLADAVSADLLLLQHNLMPASMRDIKRK